MLCGSEQSASGITSHMKKRRLNVRLSPAANLISRALRNNLAIAVILTDNCCGFMSTPTPDSSLSLLTHLFPHLPTFYPPPPFIPPSSPSISTVSTSLRMARVVPRTRKEKRKVQMGSISFKPGCNGRHRATGA